MQQIISFWNYIKPLIRSTVDCYILPGTMMGTEICWLYVMQWKKEISTFSLALLSLMFSNFDLMSDNRFYSTPPVNEQNNIQGK